MKERFFSVVAVTVATFGFTLFAAEDSFPARARSTEPVASGEMIPAPAPKNFVKGNSGPGAGPAANSSTAASGPVNGGMPFVASLDVYGSKRVTDAEVKKLLGKQLAQWLELGIAGDAKAGPLEKKLLAQIKKKWDLQLAEWSIVQYFEAGSLPVHITLDVVEKDDVASRMPFYPEPKERNADPGNLIKEWLTYENVALDLVEAGQLEPDAEECVAFHCPFGHKNAKLKPFEKTFTEGVPKHVVALEKILKTDERPDWRAAAAYLLAYLKDGKRVVADLAERIRDPDALVRNNSLRVLGDIAEFHHQYVVPEAPVLEALSFPRASDRAKALYVLYNQVLSTKEVRDRVVEKHVPQLIEMLSSSQPDHSELAHAILRKVSGRDYASGDMASWKTWGAKTTGSASKMR